MNWCQYWLARRSVAKTSLSAMKEGFRGDGSKAERGLGITYTPVRIALEEAIAPYA